MVDELETTIKEEQEEKSDVEVDVEPTLEIEAGELEDRIAATDIDFSSYRGFLSGQKHGHSMNKHDIRDLGVKDEFISNEMITEPTDHAALWELSYRKENLNNDEVFEDDVDTESAWDKIESVKSSAYIDDMTHDALKEFSESER